MPAFRLQRTALRWGLSALIASAAVLLQWVPESVRFLAPVENLIKDPLRRIVASSDPESRLVVIDIDEASIAATGPWPWPRSRIADLLEALASSYGARMIGLDVVFPSAADEAGDARIAALAGFAPLALAQALDFVPRSPALASGQAVWDAPSAAGAYKVDAASATGYVANHSGLAGASCVGNIGLRPDDDGRIRRVPLVAERGGQRTLLLPLAMLACPLQRGGPSMVPDRLFDGSLGHAGWELPFARKWEAYTVIPAAAVLDGSAPVELVRDRWVLVGSSALGLNDRAATPLAASAAGVMVHAAAMTSLLDRLEGKTPAAPNAGRWIATIWTVLTLMAGAWALGRFRAWWLVPASLVAVMGWTVLAAWLVSRHSGFSASAPFIAYLLMLLAVSLELWMTQREQGQILKSFATYVAPSVLEQMLRRGLEDPMLPQHGTITVISADMQDYTGITQRAGLQDAAQLTREFLQCLTEPVLAHGGTLDKYTGDGLVAFWGAPLASDSHSQQALRAAREIVEHVRAWNERRVAQGKLPARVRVGVESGPVLVGDLGTRFRRTYTAVGDCINTASKLQAVAKTLTCDLVVGPEAARLAGDCGLQPLVRMQLPGHNETSVLWSFPLLGSSLPQRPAQQLDGVRAA